MAGRAKGFLMKKRFLFAGLIMMTLLVVAIIFFLKHRQESEGGRNERCNLLLIVSDSLRWDILGCYGGDARTPNIDRLAREGALFEQAYTTAPCTIPASIGIMTGNYSRVYAEQVFQMDDRPGQTIPYISSRETLFPEVLHRQGYDLRRSDENRLISSSNILQGFSPFAPVFRRQRERISKLLGKSEGNLPYNHAEVRLQQMLYPLLSYLLTVPRDRNFMIFKWFTDPHFPYRPPRQFTNTIPRDTLKLTFPKEFYTTLNFKELEKISESGQLQEGDVAFFRYLYRGEVEWVDERVGYILKALDKRGLRRNTLVVLTADHGELLGENGGFGHGANFSPALIRVPLVFSGPGIPRGIKERTPVSHVDLVPTLRDLLSVDYKEDMMGRSYAPLFAGEKLGERPIYLDRDVNHLENRNQGEALVMGDFILTRRQGRGFLSLCNFRQDPWGLNNLVRKNPLMTAKMLKALKSLQNAIERRRRSPDSSGPVRGAKAREIRKNMEQLGYL